MKPLNRDSDSCDPISSECVIWQGRDIECIKLCKGDTVSDVVGKLATELCEIMDSLDITGYDLSCFNITSCPPEDFHKLIQFLIERICKLEQCTGCIPDCKGTDPNIFPIPTSDGCPNCIVSIAPCFYFLNPFGDTVTTMQLSDYVTAIGNKVCTIAGQIATMQATLLNHSIRLAHLESIPPPVLSLPTITPICVLPPTPTDIAAVLQALEQQFCMLRSATGIPDDIYQAIAKQCNALSTSLSLGTGGVSMGSIPGWVSSPTTAADSLSNLWLTLCDLRVAVSNIKINCCPSGCEGISVSLQLLLVGSTLKMYFTGTIPVGFQSCAPAGTMFTITDTSGGLVNVFTDIAININNIGGVSFDLSATPLNLSNNLTVVGNPCFFDSSTSTTCQSCLQETYYNVAVCPILTLTPELTGITYSAPVAAGTSSYTIQVYDSSGLVLITSYTQVLTGPTTFVGVIGGLVAGTLYKVRLSIIIGGVTTQCPFQSITTLGAPCLAPTGVEVSIVPVIIPSIDLGLACGYAILGGESITSASGTIVVTGSVGLDPGSSMTGVYTVSGSTDIDNPAAVAAKAALVTAYNAAAAALPTLDLTGIDLGGMILAPGVYFFASSALITGSVTLNGAGTYIFQIGSTLTTDGTVDVILTGGATADKVFWQVGSSATIGASSTFYGTILAHTSISINGGTINGSLMANTGSVTFASATNVIRECVPVLG